MSGPAEMIGTALTGYGWQTYYVTAGGDLLVHVGATVTAGDEPDGWVQVLGSYESVELARAVARQRLRRDVRMASDDMRVAFADIAALIEAMSDNLGARISGPHRPRNSPLGDAADWSYGPVAEAPVAEPTARRSLPGLIRA